MKVLEFIGRSTNPRSKRAGKVAFQYTRRSGEIVIDKGLQQNPDDILIINSGDWDAFLTLLPPSKLFAMSLQKSFKLPHLYKLISKHFGRICRNQGRKMQDFTPPIIAILKNEGSIELYHGPAGQGIGVSIILRVN